MKRINIILIISFLVSLWACEPRRIPVRTVPDSQLLFKAESLLQRNAYNESLAAFESYLSQFPDSPSADEALMKIAAIHTTLGNEKAAIYDRPA